jgi:type IX secretion system PorP/SprF family membrane protein
MKLIVLFIVTCAIVMDSVGQQNPQYSQYMHNTYLLNPAISGTSNGIDAVIGGRSQWSGLEGAPQTAFISLHTPIAKKLKLRYNPAIRISNPPKGIEKRKDFGIKHAIGGQLLVDQYGAFTRQNASFSYAMHLPLSQKLKFSVGLRAGMSNNVFDQSKAQVLNIIDNSLNYNDPTYNSYISNNLNKFIFDFGAGLYVYTENLFLGLNADNLTRDLLKFGVGNVNFNTQMHYNAIFGYNFRARDFTITPSVLIKKMQPTPFSIDASVMMNYKGKFWFGPSYRHGDAVIGIIGISIKNKFRIGYSYDYSISRFNAVSSGGHEIMLGLKFGSK